MFVVHEPIRFQLKKREPENPPRELFRLEEDSRVLNCREQLKTVFHKEGLSMGAEYRQNPLRHGERLDPVLRYHLRLDR